MSHALRVGVVDQIGYFRAYNTDGSAKTDLTSSTTGLALSVFRVGAAAVSISSLSSKAADNTTHADGAIRAVSGNLYTVDLPDAACADQVPSISVKGSYTDGVIEGPEHPLIGYNPASVAVGANTVSPATPANVSDVQTAVLAKLPAALIGGRIDASVGAMANNTLTAAAISADAGAELAALVETYIVNEGDATAVMQAIADKIAADWVAGDASPLAIASAVWAAGSRTITGGSLTTSPPTTAEILTALGTGSWATSLASQSSVTQIVNALPASGHLAGSADSNGAAVLDTTASTKIDSILEDTGTTLPGLIEGIGGGSSLTGPYTRTITVTDSDSSAAIQNAKVRLYRTGETGTSTTNASGVASFTVEAATWSYAITANGYTGVTGTIVVSADGDTAVELDAATVTPPTDPALCAVTIAVRDQYGGGVLGEPVEITFVEWSAGATYTPPVLSVPPVQETGAGGVVNVELYRQAVYRFVYGSAQYTRSVKTEIPDAGTFEVEI